MLEEPMKNLIELYTALEDLDKTEMPWYLDHRKQRDETIANLTKIIDDAETSIEVKALASEVRVIKCDTVVLLSTSNILRNYVKMLLINIRMSLIVIDLELTQLQKPAGQSTTEDAGKTKLLEENIASLKSQLEKMKPIFERTKKDYAKRKKWIKDNQ